MSIRTHFLAALVAVPLAFAATSASAESVCGAEFDALAAAINAEYSGLSDKDRAGMELKAQLAEIKLGEGKIGDSMEKLDDIQTKIDQLASAPKTKISAGAVAAISSAVADAGACVFAEL